MSFMMGPDQVVLYNKLTPLEKVLSINVLAGMVYHQAWRAARPTSTLTGRNATQKVCTILKRPKVAAFIESVRGMQLDNAIMSRQEALARLSTLGRANLGEMVEFKNAIVGYDENDRPIYQAVWSFKDSDKLTPEQLATIAELGSSKEGMRIKQHDPMTAIRRLSEMQGWNSAKKLDLTSSDGSMSPGLTIDPTKLSTQAMEELLALMDGQADKQPGNSGVAGDTEESEDFDDE